MANEERDEEQQELDAMKANAKQELQYDLNRVLQAIKLAGFDLDPAHMEVVDKFVHIDLTTAEPVVLDAKLTIEKSLNEVVDLAGKLGFNVRLDRTLTPSGEAQYSPCIWRKRNADGDYD